MNVPNRLPADKFGITIRLVLGGIAVVLLWSGRESPLFAIALGAFLATNVAGLGLARNERTYRLHGRTFLTGLRWADIIVLSASVVSPLARTENLWILALPIIGVEAVVSRSRDRIFSMSGMAVLIHSLFGLLAGVGLSDSISVAAMVLMACIGSVALARHLDHEEQLSRNHRRLRSIVRCSQGLDGQERLASKIEFLIREAVAETSADCGYVLLGELDAAGGVRIAAKSSEGGVQMSTSGDGLLNGLSSRAARTGSIARWDSVHLQPSAVDGIVEFAHSAVAVPLVGRVYDGGSGSFKRSCMGTMTLAATKPGARISSDDVELAQTLAALVALAVSNEHMEEANRASFLSTLETLARSLDARDEYTQGHSQRVSHVALLIADVLGVSRDEQEEIRIGTILHDIGKIGVPDNILNKPTSLNDEEYEVMKSHTVIGYEICKPLRLSPLALSLIRSHHERLDGGGYPDGLLAEDLPLPVRIVSVADSFDAMSSRRAYRGYMSVSHILSELERCKHTQLDPVVVDALVRLCKSGALDSVYASYWNERGETAA